MQALCERFAPGKIPLVPKEYESAVASLSKHPDKLRELLTVVGIDPAAHEVDLCWNKQYNTDTGQDSEPVGDQRGIKVTVVTKR